LLKKISICIDNNNNSFVYVMNIKFGEEPSTNHIGFEPGEGMQKIFENTLALNV